MSNFENLINNVPKKNDKVRDYFLNFFTKKNFKEYEIDPSAGPDSVKAIKTMFESKKDLEERTDLAFSYDPLCLEAFFVYFITTDDAFVNFRFKTYYGMINSYADLPIYQKKSYLRILEFYVEFLLDLHNYTTAIKIQRQIIRLSKHYSRKNINRLSYMYSTIEEADDFYRLYLDAEFDGYDYLMLIVTLLKHEDELRAKEVVLDMFKNIPCSTYLDHMWELYQKDKEQHNFYLLVEECINELNSVPDFFSFVSRIRESAV
ncbi:MAG: hypothetical protein IK151_05830 [Erysipelotrichaceae bacterium]|nr:hypothetical protein [Erysipelotrichaceae bacterium]